LRASVSARALLAALYQPIWTSAIDSAKSLALALALFAALHV
jgi:hypothetical protein